jgi:hypothetical protein
VIQAATNREAFADIAHALKLMEGDPMITGGRIKTLHDLLRRADEAESTHDPQVIQQLCTSLNAFLDEELAEAKRIGAKAHGESEAGACEVCGHGLEGAHEDPSGRVCMHCGHKMPYGESDDDEFVQFMPYNPKDESEDEVRHIRHHRSARRKRETAAQMFRRTLRGTAPRVKRHQSAADAFATLLGLPSPASSSPRPRSAASTRFTRVLQNGAMADRADRLWDRGKSSRAIFKSLIAG